MSSIDEIKSRIDIIDLVSEAGVKLRRAGKNYTGFCPFHSNTRTPSFVVWPETGTWRCFGACNEGGDIFKFVMKREGWDFPETLRRLAEKAGVQLESFAPERVEQKEEHERLRTLLEDAIVFFRQQLFNTPVGKSALDYLLNKRGLTPATVETFGLGYAPESWDATLKHFIAKGYSEQEIYDAGLTARRDSGGMYDRFRHRITIPIRDANGKMTGFGARVHPDDPNKDQAKFINSSETPLFSKGRLLYGLDRARKPIRAADQVVIVEGYLDVIAVHQAGFENVVSPMGTALTEDQLRLLKKFTRRIVLALDPDTAGKKAVLRGLEAARQSLDRAEELGFDPRGLLRHEARLQADLRVASMPEGLDPDEIVQRNPEEWKTLIANAQPVVEHVLSTLVADKDVNDPKVKSEIVAQMMPLIEDLPNPVERDSYRQMLARRLRVDERALVGGQAPARSVPRRRVKVESAPQGEKTPVVAAASPSRKIEKQILTILLKHPDLLHRLDRILQESGLSALTFSDFGYTDTQMMLHLVRQSLEQDAAESQHFVDEHLEPGLDDLYAELHAQKVDTSQVDKLVSELFRQVIQLRRLALTESVNQLRFQMEESQLQGESVTAYQEMVLQHVRSLNYLDQARKKLSEYRKD